MNEQDPLTKDIIGAAIEVHRYLEPGLLESAYEQCLCYELSVRDIAFGRQVPVPVIYKGEDIECGFRADLIVKDKVIVELKAVDKLHPINQAQLLTYLRLANMITGLLINFNVSVLKDGIKRVSL